MMSTIRLGFSLILASWMLLASVHSAGVQSFGDVVTAAVPFEVLVSPAGDADPRNETSIAVSLRDEKVIVGTSKVIVGGGAVSGRGDTRVAYYYSSNGGPTWGTGLLG